MYWHVLSDRMFTNIERGYKVAWLTAYRRLQVNLQLLEQSQITRSVSSLFNHEDADLADLAKQVADEWRTKAQRSLTYASDYLRSDSPQSECMSDS